MELWLREQQSKGFEDASDLVFERGDVFLHCQPDFFDVDTKVVVDELEINRVVTLRRQADVPSECGRGGKDSEMLR